MASPTPISKSHNKRELLESECESIGDSSWELYRENSSSSVGVSSRHEFGSINMNGDQSEEAERLYTELNKLELNPEQIGVAMYELCVGPPDTCPFFWATQGVQGRKAFVLAMLSDAKKVDGDLSGH